MFQAKAKVIKNIEVAPKYYKIVLSCPRIAERAKPGQFLNVKITNGYEPLLRRPFGVHRLKSANIEVFFEVVGKGTEILSQRRAGEYLDIIGPLGNGFSLPDARRSILVAGGMGVAPLLFLAQRLRSRQVTVLIGAKTKKQILCEKEFNELGCEVKIATDDGSAGFKGYVSDLLKNILSTTDYGVSTIFACGPKPMLKEISSISKKYEIPTQISLEEHMGCGIGACLGCVVDTKQGFKRVCKEGPVFLADDIIW